MNRAQILMDEARAEIEDAISNVEPITINDTATARPVLDIQCNQNNSNSILRNLIEGVVSNISAQCRGTRGCQTTVTASDIVFTFSHQNNFDCVVTGTLCY